MQTDENRLDLTILGLSRKEERVLYAVQEGIKTPLSIMRNTHISRSAIYAILQNLKRRGLIKSHITNGRKWWGLASLRDIEEGLYATKRTLLKIPLGREEVHGLSDGTIIVHRGKEAVQKILGNLLIEYKGEHFYALLGNDAAVGWTQIFDVDAINHFNRTLKKNNIIAEMILEKDFLKRETERLGKAWAKDFEGRTSRTNIINAEYFKHGSQIFIFRHSTYLLALGEEIVIEIRNSEIQKMILSFFRFMQENSDTIDANALLRKLIEAKTKDIGQ